MAKDDTRRASLDEIKQMNAAGRLSNDPTAPVIEELDDAFWANATIVEKAPKKSIHLRIDADVLEFFKRQGDGHLTRMNAVLRSYVDAHR